MTEENTQETNVTPEVTSESTTDTTTDSSPEVAPEAKPVTEKPTPEVVAETPKEVAAETKTATAPKTTPQDGHWWWGTGRRKAAVARVRIRPGTGEFIVNKKDLTDYFSELRDHKDIIKVLEKTNTNGSLDVFVNTNGGGYTGQGGAIILGLGRALAKYDPSLDGVLSSNGYLSRDSRRVERKKPG
nr:30S ribosomal protein S9 [Planctomycetota bacterium]